MSPVDPRNLAEEHNRLINDIKHAISVNDSALLRRASEDVRMIDYNTGESIFSQKIFEVIAEATADEKFLKMEGSSSLLFILITEKRCLSPAQLAFILPFLVRSVPGLSDVEGSYICIDIIGRQYGTSPALDALASLSKSESEIIRQLIPYGLVCFLRVTREPSLINKAREVLREMRTDSSDAVRSEVADWGRGIFED